MKNLHRIFLLTFVQFLEGESMISNQKHSENHKQVSTDRLSGNAPANNDWKAQNPNARFLVRTAEKVQENEPRAGLGLNEMDNVDKGNSFFRKGRLTSEEDGTAPHAPETDAVGGSNGSLEKIKDSSESGKKSSVTPSDTSGGKASGGDTITTDDATKLPNKPIKPKLSESNNIDRSTEIDDLKSTHLCDTLIDYGYVPQEHDHNDETRGLETAFLWVPIRHFVPGFSRGIALDAPVYASGCFKWKLKKCEGKPVWPLMKPCTYWYPAPLRTEQCGYTKQNIEKKFMYVRGRPKDMQPGHCQCDWPCIPYFDAFQRCRVEVPADAVTNDEQTKKQYKVYHNEAQQLCRAIAHVSQPNSATRVSWLPFRIASVFHTEQPSTPCFTWEYNECTPEVDDPNCGFWNKVDGKDGDCPKEEVAVKATNTTLISARKALATDCPGGFPCVKKRKLSRHSHDSQHKVIHNGRESGESALIGAYSLWLDHAACPCEWPCLPFYDPINKCVDENGQLLVDANGENYLPSKNFVSMRDQGLIECTRVQDDICCSMVRTRSAHDRSNKNSTSLEQVDTK